MLRENITAAAGPPGVVPGPPAHTQVETFSAAFAPDTWDDGDSTVDCVFYSGAIVPRVDFWTGEPYDLVLSLEPGAIRMDRLNNGAPVVDNHNTFGSIRDQLGVVKPGTARVEKGKAVATLQFSQRDELAPLRADIKAGIVRNVSVGAQIVTKNETTPKGQDRKQFTAIDWEPYEISLTMVPADAGAVLMSAAAARPQNEVVEATASAAAATRAISPKEQKPMENATITAGAGARSEESAAVVQAVAPPAVDEQKLRDEAVQAERLRVAKIREMTLPFQTQLGERFSFELIDSGASSENAGIRILERLAALGKAEPPTDPNQPGNATVTRDAGDTMRESMAAYILYRDNPSSVKLEEGKGREYVGMRLSELARECLEVKGVRTRGMNPDRIALSALTTTDFPAILANVANKTLREGYLAAPRTFTQFCRQVSAVDFKPVNRVQMSDLQALQPLNETGEYHRAPLSDSVQTYALATFGEVVAIDRKVIINDDLQAMTRIPFQLGVAAARLESDTVWAVITGNQVMIEDGNVLFFAAHNNLFTGAGSALSLTSLATSRSKFRLQRGPKGTYLNLEPTFLIVPTSLETAAMQLIAPINLVATTSVGNVIPEWVRTLNPVVEPRLDPASSTAWYLAAKPTMIDTIEFCYLEGQDGVYIETRQGFDVDGFEIKARLDFASAAIDFRGLQKNAGV